MRRPILLLAALTIWSAAHGAQNPVDLQKARNEAASIHRATIQQVAKIVGKPEAFVRGYANKPEAGRMSEEIELTGRQHRELRRLVAEQNMRARQAYEHRGLPVPRDLDTRLEF